MMPDDAARAWAREVRDRIWHRMKQVLDDGDSLVGRNESLRVVLDDEIAAALRAYGGERARQQAEKDAQKAGDRAATWHANHEKHLHDYEELWWRARFVEAEQIAEAIRARTEWEV